MHEDSVHVGACSDEALGNFRIGTLQCDVQRILVAHLIAPSGAKSRLIFNKQLYDLQISIDDCNVQGCYWRTTIAKKTLESFRVPEFPAYIFLVNVCPV